MSAIKLSEVILQSEILLYRRTRYSYGYSYIALITNKREPLFAVNEDGKQ